MFGRRGWYFDADEASGGVTPPPGTGTAPGQQSGKSGEQTPAGGQGTPPDVKTLPTAEFNDRLAQAKRGGQRDLLAALGFKDLETPEAVTNAQKDLADLVTFARQQREAEKTVEERTKDTLDDLTRQLEEAKQALEAATRERDQAKADLTLRLRNEALLKAATRAKHPEDVIAWAEQHLPDQLAKVLNEDRTVNQEVVTTIVAECVKARRDWFQGVAPGSPSNADGKPPKSSTDVETRKKLALQTAKRGM